jgi:hypothetical protein
MKFNKWLFNTSTSTLYVLMKVEQIHGNDEFYLLKRIQFDIYSKVFVYSEKERQKKELQTLAIMKDAEDIELHAAIETLFESKMVTWEKI